MRVLFLDIDGVLNSEQWMLSQPAGTNFIRELDRSAVALLAEIIERTQAKIVISSSWRHMYSLPTLRELLAGAGLPAAHEIIGATPALRDAGEDIRGREIQQWLDEAACGSEPIELFAILDDDTDMAHLAHRLVRTDFNVGLDRVGVEQTVALLTPDNEQRCQRCCSTDVDLEPAALGAGAASFNVNCRTCGAAYCT